MIKQMGREHKEMRRLDLKWWHYSSFYPLFVTREREENKKEWEDWTLLKTFPPLGKHKNRTGKEKVVSLKFSILSKLDKKKEEPPT